MCSVLHVVIQSGDFFMLKTSIWIIIERRRYNCKIIAFAIKGHTATLYCIDYLTVDSTHLLSLCGVQIYRLVGAEGLRRPTKTDDGSLTHREGKKN